MWEGRWLVKTEDGAARVEGVGGLGYAHEKNS